MIVIDTERNGWHHMTSDNLDELHSFASEIGLKRKWFQDKHWHPHYDLMTGKSPFKKAVSAPHYIKLISKREYLLFVLKHHRDKNRSFVEILINKPKI